jgi:hypothetical protein
MEDCEKSRKPQPEYIGPVLTDSSNLKLHTAFSDWYSYRHVDMTLFRIYFTMFIATTHKSRITNHHSSLMHYMNEAQLQLLRQNCTLEVSYVRNYTGNATCERTTMKLVIKLLKAINLK